MTASSSSDRLLRRCSRISRDGASIKTLTASGSRTLQLSRTLNVDVEYHVAILRDGAFENAPVGPVVVAENLRPFEEFALPNPLFEGFAAICNGSFLQELPPREESGWCKTQKIIALGHVRAAI